MVVQNRSILWLLVLVGTGTWLYWPGRHAAYFGDDFQWFFDPPPASILHYFTHRNEHIGNAYRPLQAAFLIAVQQRFGLATLPIHGLQVLLHCLLSWLLFVGMRKLGFSAVQAGLASLLMLISQANVMAVMSNDTVSQVAGGLFGCASLGFLLLALPNPAVGPGLPWRPDRRFCTLSVVLFGCALLAKETSTSFLPILVLLLALAQLSRSSASAALIGRGLVTLTPYLILLLCYLWVRAQLDIEGATSGTAGERYGFRLQNVPVNFVLFGVQALLPLSSVKIYEAIRLRIGPTLVVAALAWVGIAAGVLVGLGRLRAGKTVWAIIGCGVLGLLPVVLLNKVSELYLYNSMPFVSMLVGAGLGKLVTDQRVRPAGVVMALLVAALGVTHVSAVRSKVALMRDLGERSSVLLNQLDPYLDLVPANGLLLLVNPTLGDVEYSVFTANGFNVLNTGFDRLYQLAGRHDFKILVRSRSELDDTTELGTHVVALTLDPATNTVRPLR